MTRTLRLTCTMTMIVLLNACAGSGPPSAPAPPAHPRPAAAPAPTPTPVPVSSLAGTIALRGVSPAPGANLSVRECQAGIVRRSCSEDWRGTFDVTLSRELASVVLTANFYQGDVLCGYAADTHDLVTAGQTVSFTPRIVYLSDEFGTFPQPCALPASTTRIVANIWTDMDWSSTLRQEFAASYSFTDTLPFKGDFAGRLTSSTPTDAERLSNMIEASGNATELGRFTLEIPHIVNRVTRAATGRYVFTAANGDLLNADFTGQATVVSPGVLSTVDALTITGGTGRFEGATGTLSAQRLFVMATGEITGTFEGTINPRR